jgi:hypothetical protein
MQLVLSCLHLAQAFTLTDLPFKKRHDITRHRIYETPMAGNGQCLSFFLEVQAKNVM